MNKHYESGFFFVENVIFKSTQSAELKDFHVENFISHPFVFVETVAGNDEREVHYFGHVAVAGDKHLAVDDSVIPVGDNETDPLHDPDMEELTPQGTDDILDFDQLVLVDKQDRAGSDTAVEEDLRQIFRNEMFNAL